MESTPDQRAANREKVTRHRKGPTSHKPSKLVQGRMDEVAYQASKPGAGNSPFAQILRDAGCSRAAYDQYCRRYPGYKERIDRILALSRGDAEFPRCPFTEENRARYFSQDYDEPINPRHLRVAIDFINRLEPGQFGLVTFPPEHAKTSLGEDWLNCGLADNPETRAVVISKTQNDATNRTLKVQARMEDVDFYTEYITDFGPFKPEGRSGRPWAASKMTILRKTPRQRDYSLQALGVGTQVQGKRIDKALLDDVVDDENFRDYIAQARYIRQSVNTRLGKTGIGLMIGTRQDEMDLYRYLVDEGFFDATLILPAIFNTDYSYELMTGEVIEWKTGEGLWPERYSHADYATMKRKAGPRIWSLTYQQEDIVSDGQAFPLDLIESAYDNTIGAQIIPPNSAVVVGIDPAAQGFTAGVALAVDRKTGVRTIIDAWNEKGLVGDGGDRVAGVVQFILNMAREYGATRLMLEDNSAFVYISSNPVLRSELHQMGCYLDTIRASRFQNNDDAMSVALSTLFSNEMVKIPMKGLSKNIYNDLVEQLLRWRPYDKKLIRDLVRAFYYAEMAAKKVVASPDIANAASKDPHRPQYLKTRRLESVA